MEANPGPAIPAVPPVLLRRFTAAESAIYPLALADPERYERAVTLVGLLLRDLRDGCADVGALVDRLPALPEHASQRAAEEGVSLAELTPDLIADAAAALRYRELVARS